MSAEPAIVEIKIDENSTLLDALTKEVDPAIKEYLEAEEALDKIKDEAWDELKEEKTAEGSIADPSEHAVLTRARKKDRGAYHRWRRAKKNLDAIIQKSSSTRAALMGRQSQMKSLRAEVDVSPRGQIQRGLEQSKRAAMEPQFSESFGG